MNRKSRAAGSRARRIAVIINPSFHYAREVLYGILRAARATEGLEFYHFTTDGEYLPAVKAWKPNGQIVFHPQQRFPNAKVPCVSIGSLVDSAAVVQINVDNVAVGKMAADYFLGRSYRHLAYVHYPLPTFSPRRWRGFEQAAKAAGVCCHQLLAKGHIKRGWPRYWMEAEGEISRWLKSLPRPIGLLGGNDVIAAQVVALCGRMGIQVPEQISVLGVDDDELTRMAAVMPISSIQLPLHQIGAEALAAVCRLIDAPTKNGQTILFPPSGVITRQSSDLSAIGDPDVAAAVEFIRNHAEQPIGVADILKVVPISRRALEQRFAVTIGRSPHQEIRRARLELARNLLLTTELKLRQVADKCGFVDLGNFTQAFRLHTGYTPAAYRRGFRQPEND